MNREQTERFIYQRATLEAANDYIEEYREARYWMGIMARTTEAERQANLDALLDSLGDDE